MNCCNKNKDSKNNHGKHNQQMGMKDKNNQQMGMKDMLKMAACCGGPLAGAAILGAFGINASFLLLLACPLMMGYMMWMMGRMQSTEDQASETEKPLEEASSEPVKQLPQRPVKELPSPSKVSKIALEKLSKEEAQSSGERKVDEEKVQTTVVTEIKPVPVSPNGTKGETE